MLSQLVAQTFNISLEVLTGCRYSCAGCTVEKNFAPLDISEKDTDDLIALIHSLKDDGFRLLEYRVGPTDIISADNGFAALDHRLSREFGKLYKALNLNMAMLDTKGFEELAALVEDVIPGKKLSVTIPMSLKNTRNTKYLAELKKRILYFKSLLPTVDFNRVYLALNVGEDTLKHLSTESYDHAHDLDLGVGIVVEFPFNHSRKGFGNLLVAEEFKADLTEFIDFMKTRVNTKSFRPLQPAVLEGFEFTYRGGELYSVPVVVENLPVFHPKFLLPRPWNAATVYGYKEEAYYSNLEKYVVHPTCGDCCFLDHCARGDVHRIMELIGTDKCLTDSKNQLQYYHVESPS